MSNKVKTYLFLASCLSVFSAVSTANVTDQEDLERRIYYKEKCLEIKKYVVGNKFSIDCFHNYHHFNSRAASNHYRASSARSKGDIKIAEYNLWHPGSLRSGFKDLELVARIMNRWDLVAATELLPVIGRDEMSNNAVVEFLNEGPGLLESTSSLYRPPGYIRILEELRKLDNSWALLLSPRGEAGEPTHVQEMVGFFYRARMVKPIVNNHCDEYKTKFDGKSIACIPNLKKEFMGRDTRNVFSRRPFMANFESGNFDFTMLTSHVIFTSPDDEEKMESILQPSFGVSSYEDIGTGVTKQTYARVAETKVILEFMQKLEKFYYEEDIIYAGDMNLTSSNNFWPSLLEEFKGAVLFIDQPTTLSQPRFHSTGEPTNGTSNDYDHFIFRKKETHECLKNGESTAEILPYYSGEVYSYIKKNYLIRDPAEIVVNDIVDEVLGLNGEELDNESSDYTMIPGAKSKIKIRADIYEKELRNLKTIKNNKIVWDDYRYEEKMEFHEKRVFMDQLRNRFYYRVYAELISDHLPISMSCQNSSSDDDEDKDGVFILP